jgi:ATP-dependent Clp protease adaptor protein ClpS
MAYQEQIEVEILEAIETTDVKDLVVFNDDFNTFDHVIETLKRVCTWLIHYKGKCAVKTGSFDELLPMQEGICQAGIDAKII